jgi:hypothetical protein
MFHMSHGVTMHPLVQAWDNFVSMYVWIGREACLSDENLLEMHHHQYYAALVLPWLQIHFSTWFTDQQHREPVHQIAMPEFAMLHYDGGGYFLLLLQESLRGWDPIVDY